MHKSGRFGEAPVPLSRTLLEDAALHNLLPRLYPAKLRSLRGNATAENLKQRTEDGKKVQSAPANGGIDRGESYHFRRVASLLAPAVSWSMARGSSWVAVLVSEERGEPVPGWFIGRRGGKAKASCVLCS